MFLSYLKIAVRHLLRNKVITAINLLGLTAAITCALLITAYVKHESSFDRFHENQSDVFRLIWVSGGENYAAQTPVPLLPLIEQNLADVRAGTRIYRREGVVKIQNRLFQEELIYVEPAFFRIFSFPLIQGNPEMALQSPSRIVLTRSAAQKYFGDQKAIGSSLAVRIEGTYFDMTVTGIMEDPPANSSIQFQVLLPLARLATIDRSYLNPNWGTFAPRTYIQLNDRSAGREEIARQITALHRAHDPSEKRSNNLEYALQPITEIHLSPEISGGLEPASRPIYLYLLIGIAVFIVLIACLNFTSLSLGNSLKRQREVGLRKTMGARQTNLVHQFLGETFLTVFFALIASIVLFEVLLPVFNQLVEKELPFSVWSSLEFMLVLACITLLVALLAGSYPALYLSRFQPSEILKGQGRPGKKHNLIRGLTAVQFGMAGFLVLCMIIVNQQVKVLLNKDLGYEDDRVIRIETPMHEGNRLITLLGSELARESSILDISGSWNQLGAGEGVEFQLLENRSAEEAIQACHLAVEPNFINTMKINIIQGRDFTRDSYQHVDEILVNEAFVNQFGWEDPVGRRVSRRFAFEDARIIGVVEDFHYQSLHKEIHPLAISPTTYITNIYVRIAPGDIGASLQVVESHWKDITNELPFRFSFLDEEVERQYRTDLQWAGIIRNASGFAVVIAMMGLFGMGLLASTRRTREVGIRKVLGARVEQIVVLLGADIIKPVFIGYLLAIPFGYYAMYRWLQNFAVRTELSIWPFFMGGVLIFLLATVTVGYQLVRAARQNPADTLRTE